MCTKGILNKLRQNHTIAKIIARFDDPNTPFKLNFNQVPNLINEEGLSVFGQCAETDTSQVFNISLNSNFFNNNGATNLGKASTILHEIMHALIYSVLQNANSANNLDINNFPLIWNAYVNNQLGNTLDTSHEFLGNNYVQIMAAALQEYDTDLPVNDSQTPEQIYTDLAWAGIWTINNMNFNNILSGQDKARINSRKEAEMTNAINNGINPSNNSPCLN